MRLPDWIAGLFGLRPVQAEGRHRGRGPAIHVIVMDGTMSSLAPGQESNAGLAFKLLREVGPTANLTVYYEAGIQWRDWGQTFEVANGRGINRQIERAYGVLASRYREGDRIVLVGYSRGAYAVRSLAGIIDRVGLVRSKHATVRGIRQAYRYYRHGGERPTLEAFRRLFCHDDVHIEAVCCWDTVKSLGIRLPLVWRWAERQHDFHNHAVGPSVRRAYHALALDETRDAYAPVLWTRPGDWTGDLEQVWFRGSHGDVGGQLGGFLDARPLSNIPLVWMLEKIESCGVPLPEGWHRRYPRDADAPSAGTWQGWGKLFLARHRRRVGQDPSERIHGSVPPERAEGLPLAT